MATPKPFWEMADWLEDPYNPEVDEVRICGRALEAHEGRAYNTLVGRKE
jgi:hypothetical protein